MATALASGSSTVLRQLNSSAVLDVMLRSAEPLRLAEVVRATSLSRPTVETLIDGLVQQGWVTESATSATAARGAGRPARHFDFNARAGHVLGVDVGANTIAVRVGDLRGQPLATVRRSVGQEARAKQRMAVVDAAAAEALDSLGLSAAEVLAVTVGTPGTVVPARRSVGISPAIPGWANSDITATLRTTFRCEVELENDANLAVVGEQAHGVAQDAADVLFLLLGERLGAGLLVGNALVRGRDGAAGELGYVPVPGSATRKPGYGPLESRVNASALVALGVEEIEGGTGQALLDRCGGDPGRLTAETITSAAAEGDEAALRALRSLLGTLADGLAGALLTLNPEMLVIGGGISRAGRVLSEMLTPCLEPLLLHPPEIRISALGSEAVLVGAVHQAVTRVQSDLLAKVSA